MERQHLQARPQLEGLESMTLLSGASAMLPGPVQAEVVTLPPAPMPISLSGTVHGNYFSSQSNPDTGTHVAISAHGRISPLGPTIALGSITIPGFVNNPSATGSLTLRDARGSLALKLVKLGPPTPGTNTAANQTTLEFSYTITGGTGRFRNVQGTGSLVVTMHPTSSVTVGGQHFSAGRISLHFLPGAIPLV